jgi:hypothetical protein
MTKTGNGYLTQTLLAVSSWAIIFSPSLIYVLNTSRFGRLPEYSGFLSQIAGPHGFSSKVTDYLLVRANEHVIAIPAAQPG